MRMRPMRLAYVVLPVLAPNHRIASSLERAARRHQVTIAKVRRETSHSMRGTETF
jgi:hypothetical protein